MLLSSGLTTPEHERAFKELLSQAAAGSKPRIHMVVTGQLASSNETPEGGLGSGRSPGELRRRRWADARKKGRLIASRLAVPVECIDCARSQGEDLREAMRDAHCIWVTGGNTFYLWQHMRTSGLDELIRTRLAAGALYVGCSAGAIVAGRSVRTALWKGWDDPGAAANTDWSNPDNMRGMALAPVSFFPHYSSDFADLVDARSGELDHAVVRLEDLGPGYMSPDEVAEPEDGDSA